MAINNKIVFAKHQTFSFRDNWIPIALQHFSMNDEGLYFSDILSKREGKYTLGLGTNMVSSLKYWLDVMGFTSDYKKAKGMVLSGFGELVKEFDSYLEESFTLQIMHYHLVSSLEKATSWYFFFNEYRPLKFSPESFLLKIKQWIGLNYPESSYQDSTFVKDINCLIQMYSNRESKKSPEEGNFCPFNNLGFLEIQGKKSYKFLHQSAETIHPLAVLYSIVDRMEQEEIENGQIDILTILNRDSHAGKIFRLTSYELLPLLNRIEKDYPQFKLSIIRTAGLNYIKLAVEGKSYGSLKLDILRAYYENR